MLIVLLLVSLFAVSCKAKKEYAVLDLGNGKNDTVEVIDGKITLPRPEAEEGYDFVKWTVDGTDVKAGEKVDYKEGMEIKAVFEKKMLKISYASGIEGVALPFDSYTVEYGEKIKNPMENYSGALTTYDTGKEFDYWTAGDDKEFDFENTVIKDDTVLTAVWKYKEYELGEEGPAGGIIFYDAKSEKTVTYTNPTTGETVTRTWRYLEAAPANAKEGTTETFMWRTKNEGTFGTKESLGYGLVNTYLLTALMKSDGSTYDFPAATVASKYRTSKTEYTDWYLPSYEEIRALGDFLNENEEGFMGFNANACCWSSSESSDNYVWALSFGRVTVSATKTTLSQSYEKNALNSKQYVRAIRQF